MTTSSVWDPQADGIEMKRKSSFSLLSSAERPKPGEDDHSGTKQQKEKLWKLMDHYEANDSDSIQKSFARHLEYSLACTRFEFSMNDAYRAAGLVVRDRLLESLNDTNAFYREKDVKRGYYFSAEYLIGRHMQNAIANLDLEKSFKDAFMDLGIKMEELYSKETDPALGNGGLGRLAACFLDSMATLSLPCWGYGIRYSYGMFKQYIENGRQVERPDFWVGDGCPFEIPRPDITYPVRLYGQTVESLDEDGHWCLKWVGGEIIQAMAYDNPIPGFDTYNTNNLRLWRACPAKEFDLDAYSSARFTDAVEQRRRAEDLSAVLYPNDSTYEGKELRLRQQYFFVSASLQDLLREFVKRPNYKWSELPDKVAVQMNDTHPTITIAEMMRLLVDVQRLGWDEAWDLTRRCCNYTNHTVMPEALEKWPVEMMERLLPRHVQIIGELNRRWVNQLKEMYGDGDMIAHLSIFEEGDERKIRMGNLAIMGSNKVNGVAALHTEIIKKETFPEYYKWCCDIGEPGKIVNMTNGVTPRRWIHCANPALSAIFTKYLGSQNWLTDMTLLKGMLKHKDSPALHKEWKAMKHECKKKLANWVKERMDLDIDPDALIDIQIKRIHEYKRQLMNIFFVIHRYQELKRMSPGDRAKVQKRVVLIGGKAASAYVNAKIIIKLIGNVSKVVNNDPDTAPFLKCGFIPNYCVSAAEVLVPASDISQHISTAGTEASGTSNMKFVMNGGLIVGTMDGANIEIREECGEDTMFIFGCLEHEVDSIKARAKHGNYRIDARLQAVFQAIRNGEFAQGEPDAQQEFCGIVDKLCNTSAAGTWDGDRYLVINDFPSFVDAQARVDKIYSTDPTAWCKLSIQAASSMAKFSTDRTMKEYADVIWGVKPAPRPMAGGSMPAKKENQAGGYAAAKK
jgi:starch phosphorylase